MMSKQDMSESEKNDVMIGREVLNYIIVELLGAGGMGSVYLAEHKFIQGNKVAIKVINPEMSNDYTRKRLEEEAKILTTLNHPNIVKFINYDIDQDGTVFLVMQYAEGIRFDKYIREVTGPVVEEKICLIFEPILDAIEYANRHNVLHRDIKPSNIIISPEGQPMVLDFGISAIIGDTGELKDKVIVGTPPYMSPELIQGKAVDKRSDIYSLGVMLDYALIGRSPYNLAVLSGPEINEKAVKEPLPRMKAVYPYVSDKLQQVVDKATEKDPSKRYQSCEDFKKALHRAVYPDGLKKLLKICSVAAAAVAILVGLLLYFRLHGVSRYYEDYVEVFSAPVGIGRISSFSVRNRSECYRFIKKKGKITRVSLVNREKKVVRKVTSGREFLVSDRPEDMTLQYSDGRVNIIKAYDGAGKCLYVKSFNENQKLATFQYDDGLGTEKTFASDDGGNSSDRITRHMLEYDSDGYLSRIQYATFQNQRVGDRNGIYGQNFTRDADGRILEISYLAFDGTPKATKWGLGKEKFTYDKNGNVVRVDYMTIGDQPQPASALAEDCYTSIEFEYDGDGNCMAVRFKDADGKNVISKQYGVAGYDYSYKNGLTETRTSIGIDGGVTFDADRQAVLEYSYDANGFLSQCRYLDQSGELSPVDNGIASDSFENDGKGTVLTTKFYGLDGNLKSKSSGFAGTVATVDSVGNVIEYRTYGPDWTPCINSDGASGYKAAYNNLGLKVEKTNIGIDGSPVQDVDGHYRITYSYDIKGNLSKESYYDPEGKGLFIDRKGVAGYSYKYDENGNLLEKTSFDENGKACNSLNGIGRQTMSYDENFNMTARRSYGVDGELVGGENYLYDKRGNVLESCTIGKDGNLAVGTMLKRFAYDNHDNVVLEQYFDRSGKPCLDSVGVNTRKYEYNDRNQRVSEGYYDTRDSLTRISTDTYSTVHRSYNAKGEEVEVSYFGTDGELILCKSGYAKYVRELDEATNRVSRQLFYGADGKPTSPDALIPEKSYGYDKYGNCNYIATMDGNGGLYVDPKSGYAVEKMEYDPQGNVLSKSYFGAKERPVAVPSLGYHKVTNKYDNRSHLAEVAYFGIDGNPCEVGGVSVTKSVYNEDNRLEREEFYDGKSVMTKKYVYEYDGQKRVRKTFNSNDVLMKTEEWNGKEWAVPAPPLLQLSEAFTRKNLPKQYSLSGNVTMTFRQISASSSGKSMTATFVLSESMYNTSSAVLEEARQFMQAAVNEAKKKLGVSGVSVITRLLDKAGREIRKAEQEMVEMAIIPEKKK